MQQAACDRLPLDASSRNEVRCTSTLSHGEGDERLSRG